MNKLKSNNTNHISPFVSLLFVKAIAECNVHLEWTMVNMVKESDEEFMQDTPITPGKLLEKSKDVINREEFKPYKRPRKTKK